MPDEPRRGGPGPGGDQAPQDDQPTGRRRRSLDSGGLSVSDLLEQHSRTNIPRPVSPGPSDTGRRAAPEPEPPARPEPPRNGRRSAEGTGRRAAPEPPRRQSPDHAAPAPEATGSRPRPANGAPNDYFAPADDGARRRPEEPGRPDGAHRPVDGPRPANGYAGQPDAAPGRSAPRQAPGEVAGEVAGAGEPGRRFPANGQGRPADARQRPEDLDGPRSRDVTEGTGRRQRPDVPGRRPVDGPGAPEGPRRADGAPGVAPRRPAEGYRPDDVVPDPPRRSTDGRQRPDGPGPDPSRRMPEGSGPRRRPDGIPGGPAPRPEDAAARRLDGGPRQRPNGVPGSPQGPAGGPQELDGPRPPADGTGRRPRPDQPGRRPAEGPGDGTGRRFPDGPRPGEHTGQRPRPGVPAADGPRRPGDSSAPRPWPEEVAAEGPRRPAEGRPRPHDLDADPRRLADGSGPRQRPDDLGDPRRLAEGRRPNGPVGEGSGPRRLAPGLPVPPVDEARRADGPRRPANGQPDDTTGQRPDPRRLANGEPGAEATGRRPDGSGPRRLAEGPPADEATGRRAGSAPRRLAEGPAVPPLDEAAHRPGAPRRLAEGPPLDDLTGQRPSAPRRLAEGPADTGRRPVDGLRKRPEDGEATRRPVDGGDVAAALDQAPAAPIADRLGSGAGPERRDQIDPASLTTEMEAISDDVKKRREVDHTLARFSAVHDELAEQERIRKERRQKLMPWKADHDEDATEYASPVDVAAEDDDEDRPRRRVRTAKHSRIVRSIKAVSLAAAVLVFVSTGLGWGAMLYIDSKIVEVDALGSNSAAVHEAEKQLGDENFLIVGSDTRVGAKPQDGVGDANVEPGARSDVLMLAHIPADRKRMVVVSVPRDLQVTRPQCEKWDPSTGRYTGEQLEQEEGVKANDPYAAGGPKCVAKFMTELTGLEINHFISVDFNGFKGMVDAVGEVEVCTPKPMKDDELGTIFETAGKHQVNGDKALDYVRARKVNGEQFGDFDRVTRQQKFMSSLLRKALSSEILLNPGKLNGFLNAFAAATVGDNIGVNDMLTLAQSMRSLEAGRVSFVTVPHFTDEGETLSVNDNIEQMRVPETKALFQAIIDGTPLPEEKPDTTAPDPDQAQTTTTTPPPGPAQGKVIDPKGLQIQVLNGDPDAVGAATTARGRLENVGYKVVISGNGPDTDKTIIKYHVGGEDVAWTLAASVPGATLVADPAMGGAVQLLIGPGWDGVVRAPQGVPAEPGKTTSLPEVSIVNAAEDPCA